MRRASIVMMGLSALVLAGCAADPVAVEAAPSLEATAAVTEDRAHEIIDATFAQLAIADGTGAAADLAPRLAGDAATVRAAHYTVAAKVPTVLPPALPADMQRVYVTSAQTWPRVMAAVSETPSDTETPVVYLWVQKSVDEPYQLTSWAHMIPGATLPGMPGPADGAVPLALDEQGVDPTPEKVLADYLEYLRQGAESEFAAAFVPDTYSQQLFTARTTLSAAAASASGAYVDTVQADLENTYVMSTQDGGALVFAPVQITSSFSVSGATIKVAGADEALLTAAVSTAATYLYRDFVVIHIPAPGQGALPSVVAAQHHLVSVSPG